MKKLLFEIGTEEIPAKFMTGILAQFKELAEKKMRELRIPFRYIKVYGTPRRIAMLAIDVAETQEDSVIEAKGPSVKIAYDFNGAPTKAAEGFARGQGVGVAELIVRNDYVYAMKHMEGLQVANLLSELLYDILTSLTFPKTMRWADHEFRFVRPIRWLTALFGEEVVNVEICGVTSSKYSRGHRFLKPVLLQGANKEVVKDFDSALDAAKSLFNTAVSKAKNTVASGIMGTAGAVEITSADAYEKILYDNFVLVDQDERRVLIRKQVEELARKEGGRAEINEELLDEVNYLVEWPTALCGKFEDRFLVLPKECLITPMREHQRYFPVLDEQGALLNKFITVRNGGSDHLDTVTRGNERVLRARLSDAEFFFKEDRKQSLADRLEKLKTVSFQEGLGNMFDKSERLAEISSMVATALNSGVDKEKLARTAALCKADLVTGMVVEFTELQGVMGREYAGLDGEASEVAEGIFEHYLPRYAGDELPKHEIGRIVSIADKLDNIAATFSRGLVPTGSQDPYALRRQALGIINIIIDGKYHLPVFKMLIGVLELLKVPDENVGRTAIQIMDFFRQRLKNMLIERGIRYDVVDAVLAEGKNDDFNDLCLRAEALNEFVAGGGDASLLLQAAARVANLCKKAEQQTAINTGIFAVPAEQKLYEAVLMANQATINAVVKYDYAAVLAEAAKLMEPINDFFENVMVMDEDERIKNNRLALLNAVMDVTHAVGDLSCIVD